MLTLWHKEKTGVFKLVGKEGSELKVKYVDEITNEMKQLEMFNLRAMFKEIVN